jgi:cobalamin biosynthesis protein CbiG
METNVGGTDGIVRILIGAVAGIVSLAILAGAVDLAPILSLVLGLVAIIMLVTGSMNTCPIYSALGISTFRKSRSSR